MTKQVNIKTNNMRASILIIPILLTLFSCTKKENNVSNSPTQVNIAVGVGKVVPKGGISNLAAPISGIVASINVEVGDQIQENDVLLELESNDAALSLTNAVNKINTQQKNLEAINLKLTQEKVRFNDIERRLSDNRQLYSAGSVTQENVRLLENEYNIGKSQLEILNNDVSIQESLLKEIRTQLQISQDDFDKTSFRSPMDGTVLDILPKRGEAVNMYDTYLILAPDAPLIVKAEIDEMFSSKIKIGQVCQIFVSGNSTAVAIGKIVTISPDLKQKSLFSDSGQDFQDRRVREIEVSLDDSNGLLIDTKVECVVQLN